MGNLLSLIFWKIPITQISKPGYGDNGISTKWVVRNRTLRRITDLKALPQYQFYSNKFLHYPYLNLCIKLISLIPVNRWYAFALGPHCKRNMTPKYTILKSAIFIQFCVQRYQRGKPSMFIMYVALKAFNDSYKRLWKAWYKPRRNSVIIHLRKKVTPLSEEFNYILFSS